MILAVMEWDIGEAVHSMGRVRVGAVREGTKKLGRPIRSAKSMTIWKVACKKKGAGSCGW